MPYVKEGKSLKKKVLLLLPILLLMTGCDVNYELTIDETGFLEDTIIATDETENEQYNGSRLSDFLLSFSQSYIPSYFNPENYDSLQGGYQVGVEFYDIKEYLYNNDTGIEATYNFNSYDLHRSRAIKECFSEITIQKNEDVYRINTSRGCNAFKNYSLLENLTVRIKTDYNVIYHNADEVEDNEYIWYINKDNYQSTEINFTFNTVNQDLSDFNADNIPLDVRFEDVSAFAEQHPIIVIGIGFLLFIIILVILLRIGKRKKKN